MKGLIVVVNSSQRFLFYISGLVNGFLCCSMRHRHNSYSSSASSPNFELSSYVEPRGCKDQRQTLNGGNQPLRNYFVNSNSMSPKDQRTVEAQLALYNWPKNQNERNGLSNKQLFQAEKSSEFNSLECSEPSSSITVIPPQGGNWNSVLSNPNYPQQAFAYTNQSKSLDSVDSTMHSEGINISQKNQINRRASWMQNFGEEKEGGEENRTGESKIRISSPSMSTSNTSSGEGLGSSVMSSGSSTSNPSSISQSTGNFVKHKVLVEGRSDSSSSSTSSSSSLSSSSGTANFTPPNNFCRERFGIASNNKEISRSIIPTVDENLAYHESAVLPGSSFVENVINDNTQTFQDIYHTYNWGNGNDDNNETYSSPLHQTTTSKRNSGILMSSSAVKDMHRNQNYTSPAAGSTSQQNNLHNLTINANFMRPIHI